MDVVDETLQGHLEACLKRERFGEVMATDRRPSLFTLPVAAMWLGSLWLLAACFSLYYKGLPGLPFGLLIPPASLAGTLVVLAVYYAVRHLRAGLGLSKAEAGTVGSVIIFGLPLLIGTALAVWLVTWPIAPLYAGMSAGVFLVILVLYIKPHWVYSLLETAHSAVVALGQSAALLVILVPVLLVIVLFSVFSQELWAAIGTSSALGLAVSIFLIILPAFLLVLFSLRKEAVQIVGEFPEHETILHMAETSPPIKTRLDRGLISQEEWAWLCQQVTWRDSDRLAADLLPMLRKKAARWLGLLLAFTSTILIITFFAYFFILFSVLLSPSLIADWVGAKLEAISVPLRLGGLVWDLPLVPIAKVSLLLGIFVAVVSSVTALTDESAKKRFTQWLDQKSKKWLALGVVYQCAASPDYQIWEYIVNDRQKGVANVSIVFRPGLSEQEVEAACAHMESRLQDYRTLVLIAAFEQQVGRQTYTMAQAGSYWQLLHNKVKGARRFQRAAALDDDLRNQDCLGLDYASQGRPIPDEWFGNTPVAVELGKSIWESDTAHKLVLHPYVFESKQLLSLEIHLTKRLPRSMHYRECVRDLLKLARPRASGDQDIWIWLYFRDTMEALARFYWMRLLPFVEYRDEVIGQNRYERANTWRLETTTGQEESLEAKSATEGR